MWNRAIRYRVIADRKSMGTAQSEKGPLHGLLSKDYVCGKSPHLRNEAAESPAFTPVKSVNTRLVKPPAIPGMTKEVQADVALILRAFSGAELTPAAAWTAIGTRKAKLRLVGAFILQVS